MYPELQLAHVNTETRPLSKFRLLNLSPWLTHGVLMFITMMFFVLWVRAPSIDDVVLYSPVNEAIESIGIIRLNGTLGTPSIYRGTPSPEVDAVWDKIALDARPIGMTLEQLLRTGAKPSPSMTRYPDEYGGDYMATVEVIHQLHCIDMLRRVSWSNHSSGHGAHESSEDFRIHLDHCIEMLRQNIMCRADVTMLTYDWVEGVKDPFPNFRIPHRCRNLEKVLDWVDAHRVDVPKSKMVRLEGNVDLPSPP
ncbi:uncharacterized protein F5891DRAFT_696520 [Suillus fuscotomentosus]|uniref:Uncharacterized protein n=1 Tax=Suillus fuscotomentosus TaxID=1912939 RepID=A0AAD4DX27_9AGAM|nr:uncharacterized protein F5891DRAFT_696520 [Suillus fuscotomentosus]KAG1895141.1 hypothetical protein F5891DRAFT_696520 [Suillus fuscotomentosus]